jgi:polyhydroxyalkanoate synthase
MAYAKEHSGSWWPLWADWLRQRSGDQVTPPRTLKKNAPAPGTYVLETLATIRDKRALSSVPAVRLPR